MNLFAPDIDATDQDFRTAADVAADNSALEKLAAARKVRPEVVLDIADIALQGMDEAEQLRWENYSNGIPIDTPRAVQQPDVDISSAA